MKKKPGKARFLKVFLCQQQQSGDRDRLGPGIFLDRGHDDEPTDGDEDVRARSVGRRREVAEVDQPGSRWRRRGGEVDHQDLPEGRVGRRRRRQQQRSSGEKAGMKNLTWVYQTRRS